MYFIYMLKKSTILPDITDRDAIIILVDAFYERIQSDSRLGPIFQNKIGETWAAHLETMYDFWESVLFRAGKFRGNPPMKHRLVHEQTPLTSAHFEHWLELFQQTLNEHFEGPKATFAWRAAQDIANVLQRKLNLDQPEQTIQFHP